MTCEYWRQWLAGAAWLCVSIAAFAQDVPDKAVPKVEV